jgi:hypothetical protein
MDTTRRPVVRIYSEQFWDCPECGARNRYVRTFDQTTGNEVKVHACLVCGTETTPQVQRGERD